MDSPLVTVKRFFIGVLLGIISAIPGISGVIIAVTLGVYERLVEDLAHLRHKIVEDFWFLLTLGLGVVVGVVIISYVLTDVLDKYMIPAMMLFFGMILGQLPQLWKFTLPEVRSSSKDYAALVVGVVLMVLLLLLRINVGSVEYDQATHSLQWILLMVIIGIIYAVSHIAPGISGSTLLLAFGLLVLPLEVIKHHELVFLLPLVIGVIVGLIGFAKVVHYLLNKYRKPAYMMIFGFAIGSIFIVLWETYESYNGSDNGMMNLAIGVVTFIIGIIVSLWLSKVSGKTYEENAVR
ncbi:hypothetical protein Mpt1_c07510 [Candidatus Methanoplasma termitum]|uniref:DUF368 domain-containing protein n=1 Tax=Candidatus Methanoplasma termitum TaxID=1577791 RepID=A0A0A7LC61_9ARCH|nr:DUF368 domain-containing protein [Candidatus Methanoplasma termitum]AIZ56634.1 hypothetical protein Mpt1_c07510 [Candidatus Methanoplasma termitum]MCL2333171.1 DUF368 domain-containing protein [Candidatus Methanoplasma sp.]